MKLLNFGSPGEEHPGMLDAAGRIRDLSGHIDRIGGDALEPERLRRLRGIDAATLPLAPSGVRIGPCVAGVGKVVCVGLNYRDHAAETGMALPAEPVLFFKATSSIVGPDDDLVIPRSGHKVDWEVELAVVIGRAARYVEESAALDHVAGYCLMHDVSERAFQLERSGQWVKGKSCDTFGPLGPYLVTRDEIPDPQDLRLWLDVDGMRMQDGTTRDMVFGVAHLVSYVSQFMSLQPGDVISTGTPAGVGLSRQPPIYLREGQVVTLGGEGLGRQRQRVVAAPVPTTAGTA